ncbi:NAC domain-containing protein 73 [Zea mays]|uniref:NAC domain-containing protein 73 n=1 Tax=Zea mays TaxID=4577 RepID=UPI001652E5DD|nr:NAC domain-containing protein 73 [Zea mays]
MMLENLFALILNIYQFNCNLAGVRQDGRASYFFHRSFEPYINENDVNNCWKKIGSHRSIILDGTLTGCKEVFALYADMPSDKRSQETDWRLHQYHLQNTVKTESEIVASKIFLASRNSLCELAEETHIESERANDTATNKTVFEVFQKLWYGSRGPSSHFVPVCDQYHFLNGVSDASSQVGNF